MHVNSTQIVVIPARIMRPAFRPLAIKGESHALDNCLWISS